MDDIGREEEEESASDDNEEVDVDACCFERRVAIPPIEPPLASQLLVDAERLPRVGATNMFGEVASRETTCLVPTSVTLVVEIDEEMSLSALNLFCDGCCCCWEGATNEEDAGCVDGTEVVGCLCVCCDCCCESWSSMT